ncbi:hypothetical protein [Taibaiella koreensis]|uniref:hypothetical protein n=1 Tax=Taibaiella koreensis TaxID=1268548 RepID=UPI0013C350CD|nr:hypothetical protein [Taibaiella koreensis]
MRRFFHTVTHLLLLLIMVQALGLNAAACTVGYEAPPATARHHMVYAAAHHLEAGSLQAYHHKSGPSGKTHCHHKAHRKYFPSKVVVSSPQQLRAAASQDEALVHYAVVTGYHFLYFKTINPPPPKA